MMLRSTHSSNSHFALRGILQLLCLLAAMTSGISCGISGGSIPPGRSATINGQVFSAEQPSVAMPYAQVSIVSSPDDGSAPIGRLINADAEGKFQFTSIPASNTGVRVSLAIRPLGSEYKALQLEWHIPAQRTSTVYPAVVKSITDLSSLRTVEVVPRDPVVQAGATIRFMPRYKDALGNVLTLPITPTLIMSDTIGVLKPDGSYTQSVTGAVSLEMVAGNNITGSSSVNVTNSGDNNQTPPPAAFAIRCGGDQPLARRETENFLYN